MVRTMGLHQGLSQSQPDNILPTELLIPAAEIKKAASLELTPAAMARSGRKVKGMKSARVATPSARATSRKVDRAGLSKRSLLRNSDPNIFRQDFPF